MPTTPVPTTPAPPTPAPAASGPSTPLPSAAEALRALLAGDLVTAADAADAVLTAETGGPPAAPAAERARAARVLAAVLAHHGMLWRAAELHRWASSVAPATPAAAGAIALVGTAWPGATTTPEPAAAPAPGDDAEEEGPVAVLPTLAAGADALTARGVRAAVAPGRSGAALTDLTRAAVVLECGRVPTLTDDSPAALAALVAIHRGEIDLARAVLDRALAADLGGPVYRRRHLLLRGWADLAGGDLPAARAAVGTAAAAPGSAHPRDDLVAVALEAALARLAGDGRGTLALWARARPVMLGHDVDLWSLLPLGELRITAARARESAWMAPQVAAGDALLEALGRPPLWTAGWAWKGFVAAVLSDQVREARVHAATLRDAADRTGPADSLAPLLLRAAEQWLAVLDGVVDADAASATAYALRDAGYGHDAARLVREAAGRTADRRILATMLGVARAVLPVDDPAEAVPPATAGPDAPVAVPDATAVGAPAPGTDPSDDASTAPDGDTPGTSSTPAESTAGHATRVTTARRAALSRREREVAALLLQGMTYRQIAEQLFISIKTVEHHVGRIRQRLGSGTRNELFADLRENLGSAS